MNLLYPKFRLSLLPAMLRYAALGAVVAGSYGILNDQFTYTISREYFTRLKFIQFQYADFGLPPRIFVAEIGVLATWWVGLVAGWLLARVAVPSVSAAEARSRCWRGFAVIFASAFAASALAFGWGLLKRRDADFSLWQELGAQLGVVDLPAFVRVAYIHNAGYAGALLGLLLALTILLRRPHGPTAKT